MKKEIDLLERNVFTLEFLFAQIKLNVLRSSILNLNFFVVSEQRRTTLSIVRKRAQKYCCRHATVASISSNAGVTQRHFL